MATNKKTSIFLLFTVVAMVFSLGAAMLTPQSTAAAELTTWQKFIKKKCSGKTADAAARCAKDLNDRLRKRCGKQANNDKYIKCWRSFINNNGGNAGPKSSPFEEEVPTTPSGPTGENSCGGVDTSIIKCDSKEGSGAIWALLDIALKVLAGLVGLAAIGGFVYGAILYTSAGDNAGQVKKAKETLANVAIGLVAFALMWAFIQFLIPGGV